MFPFGLWSSDDDGVVVLKRDLIPTDHMASYKSRNNTRVDWGDGTIEDIAASVQANHVYAATSGEVTVRVVDISQPRTRGMNIDFSLIHALSTELDPGWKEVTITDSLMDAYTYRATTISPTPRLKKIHIVGSNPSNSSFTGVSDTSPASGPEEVIIDDINKNSNYRRFAWYSKTLKKVKLGISGGSCNINSYEQFLGATALVLVEASGAEFERTEEMFTSAGAPTGFEYRTEHPPTVKNAMRMFASSKITAFPTSWPELIDGGGMFSDVGPNAPNDCPVLSMPKLEQARGMFFKTTFETIGGIPDSSNLKSINLLVFECHNLKHVGDIDCTAVTNGGADGYVDKIGRGSSELLTIKLNGIKVSFSLNESPKMTTASIDDVYARLGTAVTGATLWMPNTPAFAASNKAVATGKGWTLATL